MKARDYLVSKGLAKAGRGKFSKAAHLALSAAIADGVTFEDFPKESTGPVKPRAERSEPVESSGIADLIYLYPENLYKAFEVGTKIERSMRSACNNCRNSLVGCPCEIPRIVAKDGTKSVAVKIVAK